MGGVGGYRRQAVRARAREGQPQERDVLEKLAVLPFMLPLGR